MLLEKQGTLELPTIVRPVQKCLPLHRAARIITGITVLFKLANVPTDSFPAFYLSRIFDGRAATHVVTAIPLKPPAGIIGMHPAFAPPFREWLTREYAEVIEQSTRLFPLFLKAGTRKPRTRKFTSAITHIHAAKDPEREHLGGREVGAEFWVKRFSHCCSACIGIPILHRVADDYMNRLHGERKSLRTDDCALLVAYQRGHRRCEKALPREVIVGKWNGEVVGRFAHLTLHNTERANCDEDESESKEKCFVHISVFCDE